MTTLNFDVIVPKFDAILARGLSEGLGQRDGQMCVEAALCAALGLPHGDDPGCVTASIRAFKIRLNDSSGWSSPASRAQHLRDLGIAQLGSKDVVDSRTFAKRLAQAVIQHVLPRVCREVYPGQYEEEIATCEREGTEMAARALVEAFDTRKVETLMRKVVTRAVETTLWAIAEAPITAEIAVTEMAAVKAVDVIRLAAEAATKIGKHPDPEAYLRLAAILALDILRDLKSPGATWVLGGDQTQLAQH